MDRMMKRSLDGALLGLLVGLPCIGGAFGAGLSVTFDPVTVRPPVMVQPPVAVSIVSSVVPPSPSKGFTYPSFGFTWNGSGPYIQMLQGVVQFSGIPSPSQPVSTGAVNNLAPIVSPPLTNVNAPRMNTGGSVFIQPPPQAGMGAIAGGKPAFNSTPVTAPVVGNAPASGQATAPAFTTPPSIPLSLAKRDLGF